METGNRSGGGDLHIIGVYLVDHAHKEFAAYSTTTLERAGQSPISFLLDDLSLGSDVYVRVKNETPAFRLAVPADGTWQHFPAYAIPSAYAGIAVAGPLVDDLALLADNGAYVSFVKDDGPAHLEGALLTRYTLALSPSVTTAPTSVVRDTAKLVGPNGAIDLWIDPSNATVVAMRLTNGSTYTSTTTFSRFNVPLYLSAPQTSP